MYPLDQIIYRTIIIALRVTGQTHDPSKKSFVPIHWLRDSQISTFTDGQWSNYCECTNGTSFWNETTKELHFLISEFLDHNLVKLSNLFSVFFSSSFYVVLSNISLSIYQFDLRSKETMICLSVKFNVCPSDPQAIKLTHTFVPHQSWRQNFLFVWHVLTNLFCA